MTQYVTSFLEVGVVFMFFTIALNIRWRTTTRLSADRIPLDARAGFPRHRFRYIDQRRAQFFVGDFDEGFGKAKCLRVKRH